MQTSAELKNLLQRIDHKGYPAYKDTRGSYEFPGYVLSIDHVQGDPFAAPSKVQYRCPREDRPDSRRHLYQIRLQKRPPCRIICCASLRARSRKYSFQAKGSGKSGLMAVSCPRTGSVRAQRLPDGCKERQISTLRYGDRFPGKRENDQCQGAGKDLLRFPAGVRKRLPLFPQSLEKEAVETAADLAEDQAYIRETVRSDGTLSRLWRTVQSCRGSPVSPADR